MPVLLPSLRHPLSQPVRLTALPKGEPRDAAVSARQITICLFMGKNILFRRLGWHPAKRHAVVIFLPADPVEAVFLGRVLRELGKDRKQGILHA